MSQPDSNQDQGTEYRTISERLTALEKVIPVFQSLVDQTLARAEQEQKTHFEHCAVHIERGRELEKATQRLGVMVYIFGAVALAATVFALVSAVK